MEPNKRTNTEQTILRCAEEVFLERGYDGARTTEIAQRAGVNHAMIHYYFRTKLDLFNVIFQDKLSLLTDSFADTLIQERPFFDKIRLAVETHFDFMSDNPKLFFFLYSEIVNNAERKKLVAEFIEPKVRPILNILDKDMKKEVEKGNIRKVKALEILLNIISLNVITFLGLPLIETLCRDEGEVKNFMSERKANNVESIINSLRPHTDKPKYVQTSLDFGD